MSECPFTAKYLGIFFCAREARTVNNSYNAFPCVMYDNQGDAIWLYSELY